MRIPSMFFSLLFADKLVYSLHNAYYFSVGSRCFMLRKIIIAGLVLCFVLSMACCKSEKTENDTTADIVENESTTVEYQQETEIFPDNAGTTEKYEITTEASTESTSAPETTAGVAEDNSVSSWNNEKIVLYYKSCAAITGNNVKSEQVIELSDISVNNGQLGSMFSFVTPILSKFLSASSTVTDGVTGNYGLLMPSDIAAASVYENQKGLVVEITLNSQTNKANDSKNDGSVAHGISVVGDLGSIMGQLKNVGLPIDIDLDNTTLTYKNPVIKVLTDGNGTIINGTWSYDLEVSMNDYKFAGQKVDSTKVVLKNTITVNGGFAV